MKTPYLLLPDEAAKRARITAFALYLALMRGELSYYALGRSRNGWRVDVADIDAWAATPGNIRRARRIARAVRTEQSGIKGLSSSEELVKAKYECRGWQAYRSGEPDFLFVRQLPSGAIEGRFVEVKAHGDRLNPYQKRFHAALKKLGLMVVVERPDGVPENIVTLLKGKSHKKRRPYGTGGLFRRGKIWYVKFRTGAEQAPDGRVIYRQRIESSRSVKKYEAERFLKRRIAEGPR